MSSGVLLTWVAASGGGPAGYGQGMKANVLIDSPTSLEPGLPDPTCPMVCSRRVQPTRAGLRGVGGRMGVGSFGLASVSSQSKDIPKAVQPVAAEILQVQ